MSEQLNLLERKHKPSQKDRILDALRQAGMWGVNSRTLNSICFRYSARMMDLRNEGHIIQTVQEKPGLFRFVLVKEAK